MEAIALLIVRGFALFAVAFAAAWMLRRRSAAVRADLWRATFVAAAVLPLASLTLPAQGILPSGWSADGWSDAALAAAVDAAPAGAPAPPVEASGTSADRVDSASAAGAGEAILAEPPTAPAGVAHAPGALPSPAAWALGVWAAGALLLLSRVARGLARARAIARSARGGAHLPVDPRAEIVETDATAAAFVWDPRPFGRPRVVLPPGGAEDRAVLAHELHHVERRDGAFLPVAAFAAAVLWPTGLARLALRRLRAETERAADDAALRQGARPSDFAASLVALAAPSPALLAPCVAGGDLRERVEALLDARADRRATGRGVRALVSAAALGLGLVAATAAVAAQDEPDAPEAASTTLARGLDALVAQQDADTGAWRGDVGFKLNTSWRVTAEDVPHVGVTGLAVEALARAGVKPDDDTDRGRALARGIAFLRETQGDAGGWSLHGSRLRSHAHALRGMGAALAATGDDELRGSVVLGLAYSLGARGDESGLWRHAPGEKDADILEVAHHLDACRAAFAALGGDARFAEGMAAVERSAIAYASRAFATPADAILEHLNAQSDGPVGIRGVGYRFQTTDFARITPNTNAAGLVIGGPRIRRAWGIAPEITLAIQTDFCTAIESDRLGTKHFLVRDADLLVLRVADRGDVDGYEPQLIDPADPDAAAQLQRHRTLINWRNFLARWDEERELRLGSTQQPDGSWQCTEGTGDAHATAIACLVLAGQ